MWHNRATAAACAYQRRLHSRIPHPISGDRNRFRAVGLAAESFSGESGLSGSPLVGDRR